MIARRVLATAAAAVVAPPATNSHSSRLRHGIVRAVRAQPTVVAFVALVLVLAGCGGQTVDKAGGKGEVVRVLRFANGNYDVGPLAVYADKVKRISGGRLRVAFVNDYRRSVKDAEPGIIDDVRAGRIELAWVGARAFRAEGTRALDPLVAPLAVTDYDTEQRVLADPVAREMLDAVGTAGVRGVALLPGPLRHLAMSEPWKGPRDLEGKRIGAPAGIGSQAIEAFGATPVVGGTKRHEISLDGTEEHLLSFLGNFYMERLPHVASQPLWPRPLVVIASPATWKKLSASERNALIGAGTSAVRPMLGDLRANDKAAVPKLCRQGARFFEADLDALRAAVAPVIEDLRKDAQAARILARIERLQSGHREPSLVCGSAAPRASAGIPSGEYTFTLTKDDNRREGKPYGDPLPAVFRVEITPGHMRMYVSEDGEPEVFGLEDDFSTFKDRFDLGNGTITGRFKVDGDGNLHFTDIEPSGEGDDFVFATKTWRRLR